MLRTFYLKKNYQKNKSIFFSRENHPCVELPNPKLSHNMRNMAGAHIS